MTNKLEFGLFDSFGPFEMQEFPTVLEVYEAHIRQAQEAEQLGYRYYFFIEHQNSPVCSVTAPNIYLTALACRTSVLRFGLMIYQLPFHHPVRLAQDLATLDQLSRCRLEFCAGPGVLMHDFIRRNLPFVNRLEMRPEPLDIIPEGQHPPGPPICDRKHPRRLTPHRSGRRVRLQTTRAGRPHNQQTQGRQQWHQT